MLVYVTEVFPLTKRGGLVEKSHSRLAVSHGRFRFLVQNFLLGLLLLNSRIKVLTELVNHTESHQGIKATDTTVVVEEGIGEDIKSHFLRDFCGSSKSLKNIKTPFHKWEDCWPQTIHSNFFLLLLPQ